MVKTVHDDVLDAALNYIKNNGDRLCICSAQPTSYTEAITTYKLAILTIDSADYTGPSNGDASGRKIRINAQTGITVDSSGDAVYVAIAKSTATTALLYVTSCTTQTLTSGNTVNTPVWDIEILDPT